MVNAFNLIDHAESFKETHPNRFQIAKTLNKGDNPVLILSYSKDSISYTSE